jgi:TPP-dependent indolepyruvate ferredoxin oxidoreductase alpha subunit
MKAVGLASGLEVLANVGAHGTRGGLVVGVGLDDECLSSTARVDATKILAHLPAGVVVQEVLTPRALLVAAEASEACQLPVCLLFRSTNPQDVSVPATSNSAIVNRHDYYARAHRQTKLSRWDDALRRKRRLQHILAEKLPDSNVPLSEDLPAESPLTTIRAPKHERSLHFQIYDALAEAARLQDVTSVAVDVGSSIELCYPPFELEAVALSMGSPIGVAGGMDAVEGDGALAVIGDYALAHSGLQAILHAASDSQAVVCAVISNGISLKTGGQRLPFALQLLQIIPPNIETTVVQAGGAVRDAALRAIEHVRAARRPHVLWLDSPGHQLTGFEGSAA